MREERRFFDSPEAFSEGRPRHKHRKEACSQLHAHGPSSTWDFGFEDVVAVGWRLQPGWHLWDGGGVLVMAQALSPAVGYWQGAEPVDGSKGVGA